MRLFASLLIALSLVAISTPAATQVSRPVASAAPGPQSTERIEAELVPMSRWAAPGSTAIVAVHQSIAPGWHTYWRNPGDSGGPTQLSWSLPPDASAGEIVWPLPSRQRLQDLMNYGYEGEVFLPVPVQIPADARPGGALPLTVKALFLVCSAEMCVPDELTLSLVLPIRDGPAPLSPRFGAAIQTVVETAPRPAGIQAHLTREGEVLRLTATGGPLGDGPVESASFFPYENGVIDNAAPQPGERGPDGVTISLTAIGDADAVSGVLATDRGAWEITAETGAPLAGATGQAALHPEAAASATGWTIIVQALVFAFIGGLILNLMPCVFPVLAMKAAGLAAGAHDPRAARRDGLAFMVGVLASFLALAGVLLTLRAGGQAIGWGFQLQSPPVVAELALLMLAVGLNLSGVFTVGTGVQGFGGSLGRLPGGLGAFCTGVLAVVVAAPCTAPFMALALGAALVMPTPLALLVFAALGLGLALPYVLVSFSPGLLARLPRPGPWMDRLRGLLAFPMYSAVLWLVWVFARQTGAAAEGLLFGAGLGLALTLWLFGGVQAQRAEGRRAIPAIVGAVVTLVATAALVVLAVRAPVEAAGPAGTPTLDAQPWSPQAVAEAQRQGRPVLVDFTADWCVTCKINERAALASSRTAEAISRSNAVYLVADWTRRDARIARELERHGRSGVPLYLVYTPGQAEPRVLPQLLTEGVVIEALDQAALSPPRPTGRPAGAAR